MWGLFVEKHLLVLFSVVLVEKNGRKILPARSFCYCESYAESVKYKHTKSLQNVYRRYKMISFWKDKRVL